MIDENEPFEIAFDERLTRFLEHLEKVTQPVQNLNRSRVSVPERAEQLALDMAVRHNFHDGLHTLIDALEVSRHPRTLAALHSLLSSGITPHELYLVLELRERWRENPQFSVVLGGKWSTGGARREFLPYQLALRLIRYFTYTVETDEVLQFIQEVLELWRDREDLLHGFPVFQHYLDEFVTHQALMTAYPEVSHARD